MCWHNQRTAECGSLILWERMTEVETLAFLEQYGVMPIGDEWQPHTPVLYVLEEVVRGDAGPFKSEPLHLRPSIVRMADPATIDFDRPDVQASRVTYKLSNVGRADYYVIDSTTQKPLLVRSSETAREYDVREEGLFKTMDDLFPKGTEKID
jgi:hypothetical protein